MIQYIYFVKCPNCEDEPFDFFDEAKDFAMGCLSDKPVITQVEVCRNDFGECTDSNDLGTVWSWEDMMKDIPVDPEMSVFTKDDLVDYDPDTDPEFDELDNSVDFNVDDVPDNFRKPIIEEVADQLATNKKGDYLVKASSGKGYTVFNKSDVAIGGFDGEDDDRAIKRFNLGDIKECTDRTTGFKKPIPEDMTIEQLVEEMEENEDTVECTWCEDLYDKSECRYEVDLGWLCPRCEAAIKSRGETLTFRENNYWDFLDEDVELEEAGNSKYNFKYLHYNEHAKEDIIAKADLHPVTYKYVHRNTLAVPFAIADVQNYPPYKTISKSAGVITDFTIENGTIMFNIDNNGRTIRQDFKTVVSRAAKKSTTADFLNAFYSIVKEVNKKSNLGISRNRDFDFATSVKKSPMLAEELRNHIIGVRYEIPLTEYTAEDLLAIYADYAGEITQEDERNADKAANNLAKIYDNFFNGWKYGKAAKAAGLVVDRPVLRGDGKLCDTLYFMGAKWHATGKITFDCPVGQLTEKTRDLIQEAKLDGSVNKLLNRKEIDCIRLAYALTSYFDNVKFYETKTISDTNVFYTVDDEEKELLTAGLDSSVLKETLDSELVTWICNFNGKEIGTVEAETEEEALEKMQLEYPEYNYGECDGCFEVYPDIEVF